jgi:hypothetical protein
MLSGSAIRSLAILTCVAALPALGVPGAAAASSPPAIVIGPIKALHGFALTLTGTCTPTASALTITFSNGPSQPSVSHTYAGGAAKCSVSGKLASGSLNADWKGLAAISLSAGRPGRVRPLVGCSGSGGVQRPAIVTGTLKVTIHPGVFGRIDVHTAAASLERLGSRQKCTAPARSDETVLGNFGGVGLSATQPANGRRSVLISESAKVTGRITDSFVLDARGGSSLFDAARDLGSAKIGGEGSALTGSLTFTALPPCAPGLSARNGSFSGTLVAQDPVLGTLMLSGAGATHASIALGAAVPGTCNGPGSTPPTARFSNFCSGPGFCSVSGANNADMYFDESDPGSGSIVSESWNFGDGSAPVSGPVGLSVSHAYANPGTYTVTLTITDGQGLQYTTTGTAYIGP